MSVLWTAFKESNVNSHWLLKTSAKNLIFSCLLEVSFFSLLIRYKEGGEALLVLLPSEEKGMVEQLAQRKVPISEIK